MITFASVMKKIRLIAISILMMTMLPICAQTGMKPGWKIGAALETASNQDFKMTDDGGTARNGSVNKHMKAIVDVSKTFAVNRKLTLGFTGGYHFLHMNFDFPGAHDLDLANNHHVVKCGGVVIFNTRLGDKPLLMMGNVSAEGGQWGIERVMGIGTAMLMLKASRDEMLGVGFIGIVNGTFSLPFFPMVIYRKAFSPKWVLNINHPILGIQYLHDQKQTLTAGVTIENEHFWMKPGQTHLPEVTMFSRLVTNTGVNYDYKLNSQTTLSAQAGWSNTFRNKMFHRYGKDELMNFGNSRGVYAKIGFTYRL